MKNPSTQTTTSASGEDIEYVQGMEYLVEVVQQLSQARELQTIVDIVRIAARNLSGADGATFVLRDGAHCYYVDEDAISPLWKGKRFDINTCISGWAMNNRQAVVIKDIYQDERIPHDAYRPTFVKSLAMVPIRSENPVGAIGNYWANQYVPTTQKLSLIQALANVTSVAMENVRLYQELEDRVKQRTEELQLANEELKAFSSAVAHDIRSPLTTICSIMSALEESIISEAEARQMMGEVYSGALKMDGMIQSLLRLSTASHAAIHRESINLSQMVEEILAALVAKQPERKVNLQIEPNLIVFADRQLANLALTNLLSNAWKYSSKKTVSNISFSASVENDDLTFSICDNGSGFDMNQVGDLFKPHSRLHANSEFEGFGIGLTTVARIIKRHGGCIRAESGINIGTCFFFNWGAGSQH